MAGCAGSHRRAPPPYAVVQDRGPGLGLRRAALTVFVRDHDANSGGPVTGAGNNLVVRSGPFTRTATRDVYFGLTAAATSLNEETREPASKELTKGHISGRSPLLPMPSTKLGV